MKNLYKVHIDKEISNITRLEFDDICCSKISKITEYGFIRDDEMFIILDMKRCKERLYDKLRYGGFISVCIKAIHKFNREEKLKRILDEEV